MKENWVYSAYLNFKIQMGKNISSNSAENKALVKTLMEVKELSTPKQL